MDYAYGYSRAQGRDRATGAHIPRLLHRLRRKQYQAGFTLIELSTTLAIAGILLTVAVPAMQDMVTNNRLITYVNILVGDFYLVRSEAVKRGEPVTICQSSDGETCTNSSAWGGGWIVFTDPDGDRIVNGGDTILRIQQPFPDNITMKFTAFGSTKNVTYFPTGTTKDRNGTFTFCDPRGSANARAVILSKTGRVRTSRTKSDGKTPLKCS